MSKTCLIILIIIGIAIFGIITNYRVYLGHLVHGFDSSGFDMDDDEFNEVIAKNSEALKKCGEE